MIWKDDRVAQTKTHSFGYDNLVRLTLVIFSDAAGRMTADASKGISSITWNVLGQLQTVTFIDGATVSYLYAADGTKFLEIRTVSGTTPRPFPAIHPHHALCPQNGLYWGQRRPGAEGGGVSF